MEILEGKYKFNLIHIDFYSREVNVSKDPLKRLIGFFFLTKEERFKAAIYVGREGRDWLEKAALNLFSSPQDQDLKHQKNNNLYQLCGKIQEPPSI